MEKIKEHVEFVHEGKKPFKCELCTTSFSNKINLRSHVSCIQEGEWPFQYSSLVRHVATVHEGKKQYN